MLRRTALALLTISVLAWAVEETRTDTARGIAGPAASRSIPADSLKGPGLGRSGGALAPDSGRADTTAMRSVGRQAMVKDSVAKKSIPPRILSFEDQLLFAMVFMSFIALMLTSMTNVNP
ncbi:MAG: hypothetical protein RL318_863 [Fibrobacterota bacterium]|jgi:hypothetical protein